MSLLLPKQLSGVTVLTCLSLLLSSRTLLEGKSIENLIQGTWASVYEMYVAVVTATTLLLKLGARVHVSQKSDY